MRAELVAMPVLGEGNRRLLPWVSGDGSVPEKTEACECVNGMQDTGLHRC